MALCHDEECIKSRSGTSYATPIIAGIAVFLLRYARLHLGETAEKLKQKDKMEALLKRCANKGPTHQPRDGYFYVELSLHDHNLFGGELDRVNHRILEALKT
jgi:hypothetical protein